MLRFLAICLVVSSPALAQPRPGETRRVDAIAERGQPDFVVPHTTLEGDIDLFHAAGVAAIDRAFARAAKDATGRDVVGYQVLSWWEGHRGAMRTEYVFAEDGEILLYAITRPSPSEDTLAEAIRRYGYRPIERRRIHVMGHLEVSAVHYEFAADGVELVAMKEPGRIDRKIYVRRDPATGRLDQRDDR